MPLLTAVARRRAPRTLVGLAIAGLVAVAVPVLGAAPAGAAVPATPAFGPGIDALAGYEGQVLCSPTAKAGAKKLASLLKATYGSYSVGISRSCSIGGQSEHKEGRALDWMVSARVSSQKAKATAFLNWLLAPDAEGNPAAMARRLGVMYIGWNDRMWRAYDIDRGWSELRDCLSNPAKRTSAWDTDCHRNHVHLSLSWDGAAGLTSFWTGVPLPDECRAPWGRYGETTVVRAGDIVPVTPVRVASTRYGESACRVTAPGWSGSQNDLVVPVIGAGEVPEDGVAAVAVRITVTRPSAVVPTVSVRSTESAAWRPVTTSATSSSMTGTAVVPVSSDGTIRVGVDRGGVDVAVDVLGWAPPKASAPSGSLVTGPTRVLSPTYVLDLSGSPLAPGASRTIDLGGSSGVPEGAPSTLALSLFSSATSGSGSVALSAPGGAQVAYLRTSSVSRVTQALVPTSDGTVTVTNTGKVAVPVRLRLQGVSSPAIEDGGATTILTAASRAIDTAAGVGLSGAFSSSAWRSMQLTGKAVPAGARAALISFSVKGGSSAAVLKAAGSGTVLAVNAAAGVWTHETVLVPLSSVGDLRLQTPSKGTQLKAYIVGYVA